MDKVSVAAAVENPSGCLGCNPEPIKAALVAKGMDPAWFEEVPRPRHAWSDVLPCGECGRCWLFRRSSTEASS